jgi:hypothetical protein
MAARGLRQGYSYWLDELWSVAASKESWWLMFRNWLIPDVHPPLYQVLLKLWMGVAGSNETATRSLSFLMTAVSLLAAACFASGRGAGRRLATLGFLGTNPTLMFCSQETRSYATSLALSTIMLGLGLLLRQRSLRISSVPLHWSLQDNALTWGFSLSCLLLSLTHYFSLLFVLVVLAIGMAEGLIFRSRVSIIPLLLAMMAWPAFHILNTYPFKRFSWLQVEPIFGTIKAFRGGVFPILDIESPGPALLSLAFIALVIFGITRSGFNLRRFFFAPPTDLSLALGEARFLGLVLITFLVLMLVIDLIKPLSQSKCYLVALPAAAYLCGDGWELTRQLGQIRQLFLASLLLAVFLVQLGMGNKRLEEKRTPLQNYKALATFVQQTGICEQGCLLDSHVGPDVLNLTYFRPGQLQNHEEVRGLPLKVTERPFLAFGKTKLAELRASNPSLVCWEPPNYWSNSAVVLLPSHTATVAQPKLHGLRPCPP